MADVDLINQHQERMKRHKEWKRDWFTLTRIWGKLCAALPCRMDYHPQLLNLELEKECNGLHQKYYHLADGDEEKVKEYSKFLAKVAKNLGKSDGCDEYPWKYRRETLTEVYGVEIDWPNIWPAEGEWKKPEQKIRPYRLDEHMEILRRASVAYVEGRTDDAFLWLQPQTSEVVKTIWRCHRLETDIIDKVLGSDENFFQDEGNREELLESFSVAWGVLMKKAIATFEGHEY